MSHFYFSFKFISWKNTSKHNSDNQVSFGGGNSENLITENRNSSNHFDENYTQQL